MLSYAITLFVGMCIGIFVASLCQIAKESDKR